MIVTIKLFHATIFSKINGPYSHSNYEKSGCDWLRLSLCCCSLDFISYSSLAIKCYLIMVVTPLPRAHHVYAGEML